MLNPDRFCWPHSEAMNTAEIDLFLARERLFLNNLLPDHRASALADRLVRRDRDIDPRVSCAECSYFRRPKCPNEQPISYPILHQCEHAMIVLRIVTDVTDKDIGIV
jgi:hypothetical protein